MFTIRGAIGGFIVEALEDMEEDADEEVVFTSVDGALGYIRAGLLALPDASETPPEGPDPRAPST